MFKSIIILFAVAVCAFAKPGFVAPLAYSAPLVAAAPVVTATSSQVVARNYNGLAAPLVAAAAPVAYTAAAAPFAYTAAAAPLAYTAAAAPLAYTAAAAPYAYSAYSAASPLAYSAPLGYGARYSAGFLPSAYAAAPALW